MNGVLTAMLLPLVAGGVLLIVGGMAAHRRGAIKARLAAVAPSTADAGRDADRPRRAMPLGPGLDRMLLRAGLHRVGVVAAWTLLALLLPSVAAALLLGLPSALAVCGLVAFGLHRLLALRARRRLDRFLAQFPTFIDRMRQLLATGNSLPQAFARALDHAGPVARDYLAPVSVRLSLGETLPDALDPQAERLAIPELSMLTLIARAHQRYGGTLADILDDLVRTLRDRDRIGREFRALSAETRASTRVLMALPVLVIGAIMLIRPDYLMFFVEEPRGRIYLAAACALQLAGIAAIRRLSAVSY